MRSRSTPPVLVALCSATAFFAAAQAVAAPTPTLRVESVGDPPASVTRGLSLRVDVSVSRTGRGLRGAVLAYYLTPRQRVGAGAVRMAGRTSLAPLRHRQHFERAVRVRVPRTTGAGAYFVTACVIVVRGPGSEQPRSCAASDQQVEVAAASGSKDDPKTPAKDPKTPAEDTKSPSNEDPKSEGDGEGDADPTRIDVFPWATSGGFDDNWVQGLGFALLGLIGALVTVYLFLGEFLPSMGGKAEYEEGKVELEELVKQRNAQLELREGYAAGKGKATDAQLRAAETLTGSLDTAISQKESSLTQERRRLVAIGMPIYLVLGGAFAVLFAANILQALLIGFGWTAIADRLGLNKELAVRSAKRDETIAKLSDKAKEGDQAKVDLAATEARADKLAQASQALADAVRDESVSRKKAEAELTTRGEG
jgi:hypothetical protein